MGLKRDRGVPGWRFWLLAGLVAYGLFLAALLPAGVVWDRFKDRAGVSEAVTADGITGTLWSGSVARLNLPNGFAVSDLRWRLRPVALLTGRLEWQLEGRAAEGQAAGRLALSPRGLTISRTRADLDAASVLTRVPLVIAGRLVLDVEHLVLTRAGAIAEARGVLGWLDAAAGLPEAVPLGSLRAELGSTDDGALRLDIRDQGGPLMAEGTVVVSPTGHYRVEGHAGARADADPRIGQALGLLGAPDRSGRTPVRLSGSL